MRFGDPASDVKMEVELAHICKSMENVLSQFIGKPIVQFQFQTKLYFEATPMLAPLVLAKRLPDKLNESKAGKSQVGVTIFSTLVVFPKQPQNGPDKQSGRHGFY